jgi:hypothetical protein
MQQKAIYLLPFVYTNIYKGISRTVHDRYKLERYQIRLAEDIEEKNNTLLTTNELVC